MHQCELPNQPGYFIHPVLSQPSKQSPRNPDANKADGQGLPTSAPPKAIFLSQNVSKCTCWMGATLTFWQFLVFWQPPKPHPNHPIEHVGSIQFDATETFSMAHPKRQQGTPFSKSQARSASKDVAPVGVFLGSSEHIQWTL